MTDDTDSLRGFVDLVRRNLRLILGFTFVTLAVAVLAVLLMPTRYTAVALVFVDTAPKDLLEPATTIAGSGNDGVRVDSEVELARSDAVLMQVIDTLGLERDPEFKPRPGLLDGVLAMFGQPSGPPAHVTESQLALDALRMAVNVHRRGLTYIIGIQAKHTDPLAATAIANAIADSYIVMQVGSKISTTRAAYDLLQDRIETVRQAMVSTETELDALVGQRVAETGAGTESVRELRAQLQALDDLRDTSQSLLGRVSGAMARDDWHSVVDALGSVRLHEAVRRRDELMMPVAGIDGGADARQALGERLHDIEAEIAAIASAEIGALEARIADAAGRHDMLRRQLRTAVLATPLPLDFVTRIYELQQTSEVQRTLYQGMINRLQDLDLQASLQVADSRVVSPALPPTSPTGLPKSLILGIAGLAGMMFGLMSAYTLESFVGGMINEMDVERALGVDAAVSVPKTSAAGMRSVADLVIERPLAGFAESLRRVRAGLDRLPDKQQTRVVMVTSLAPGDGKSSIALALARTYAVAGRRTLLVDGDFRRPKLHRLVGHKPEHGLADILGARSGFDPSEAFKSDPLSDAMLLLGARDSVAPTDGLAGDGALAQLLEAARSQYDMVIIDTAPVGAIIDAAYEARHADALVFVARWAQTREIEVGRALGQLRRAVGADQKVVLVLNQVAGVTDSYPESSRETFRSH
jgi:succinoglycan biosynthesis transport protein ExoP